MVVSLPALEHLRSDYTEVWVAGQNVPLVRFAERVRAIASTGLDVVGYADLESPALRELERFDSIVSWYGTNRPEFRDAVSRLPFTFYTALPGADLHATDFYMRQVGGSEGAVPHIEVPRSDGGFVAVQPFSGSPSKNWPLEKFKELAKRLPIPVRYAAGPEESMEGALRFDNLYEVACWLGSARAYVGNDSGITHLAAAVGIPVVSIFRKTDPRVWAPRGKSVRILEGSPMVEAVRLAVEAAASVG